MEKQNSCVLKLEHLIFDELHFDRKGFQNKNSIQYEFGFNFEMRGKTELIAHILLQGEKPEEYSVLVRASGYFVLDENSEYDRLTLRQNAVAIVFPYMRTQLSLLTSQPEIDTVVLQPLNIAQMVEDTMKSQSEK